MEYEVENMKALKNKLVALIIAFLAVAPLVAFPGVDGTGSVFLLIIAAMMFFEKS